MQPVCVCTHAHMTAHPTQHRHLTTLLPLHSYIAVTLTSMPLLSLSLFPPPSSSSSSLPLLSLPFLPFLPPSPSLPQDWKKDEPPEADSDGHLISPLPRDVFEMMQQNVSEGGVEVIALDSCTTRYNNSYCNNN